MRLKNPYLPIIVATLMCSTIACSRSETKQTVQKTQTTASSAAGNGDGLTPDTPFDNKPDDRAAREQQRFNEQWRQLQSFRQQQAAAAARASAEAAATPMPSGFQFAPWKKESFKGLDAAAINAAPAAAPIKGDVSGPSVLRAQVYLDRMHFSVGSIDGRWGRNSAITVWWYQHARGVEATGMLDEQTYRRLASDAAYAPVVTTYTVTADDLKGPFVKLPDDVYEKAKLQCLCYETVKEELAEHFHSDPDFLDVLNPGVKWEELTAGSSIVVPNVRGALQNDPHDIAKAVVSIAGNSFNGFDAAGNLVFHAPTTVGSTYDPSPDEALHVVKIVRMPHFHYDPTLYHEVPDSDPDAQLSPGANSPVGVVWMALSKPHYGIHGTADPESIGYASSHGCIRLTNWDADEASHRLGEGTQVAFVDPRGTNVPDVAKR